MEVKKIECEICGDEVAATTSNKKYCLTCARDVIRQRDKDRQFIRKKLAWLEIRMRNIETETENVKAEIINLKNFIEDAKIKKSE